MDRFAEWFARPYVALCFLAIGMAVIPLNDALIKLLGDTMPLGQIVTIRSLMSLALIALFSSGLRRMMGLSRAVFWQFVGRGMCLVVAMVLFFASLGSLSLSSAVAIFFTAPLMIALLSVLLANVPPPTVNCKPDATDRTVPSAMPGAEFHAASASARPEASTSAMRTLSLPLLL